MVISPQVIIKLNPEHTTLAEYIADNPNPACPLVGLEHITEFWPSAGVCSDLSRRPFYHCSVGECYNEQGNSRQIMQHLVRRHHVEGWIKEKGMVLPPSIQSLVFLCKKIAGDKLDMSSLKVILSKDLWVKCKKARLRLRKEEADQLFRKESDEHFRKESVKNTTNLNTFENISINSGQQQTTSAAGVVGSISRSLASPRVATEPVKEVGTAIVKISSQPELSGSKVVTSPSDVTPSPVIIPTPVITPTPIMTFTSPNVTSTSPNVIPSTSVTLSSSLVTPPATVSQPPIVPHASGETLPELKLVTQEDISFATLKLSDINPNVQTVPNEAMEVSDKVVETLTEKDGSSTPDTPEMETEAVPPVKDLPDLLSTTPSDTSSKKVSKPAVNEEIVDLTEHQKTPQSAGSEEIIDLTGPQKKLSLKEYQEKLRKENTAVPHDDVKPFEEDDEVEVIGIKEGNAKSSRSGDPPEPPFKREKPCTAQLQDLLDRSSGDVVVEGAVKAPPPNPIMVFKIRVTDRVKTHLLDYYAKDSKDRHHKDGRMKEIKIRNDKEFINYCKTFSKKFQADILEAHVAINGSEEGIEMVDVRQYGIGHDIDKFFSEIKIKL